MKKLLSIFAFLVVCQLQVAAQGHWMPGTIFTLNNQPKNDSSVIELFPGETMDLVINTTSPNSTDSIKITSNITAVLPGVAFSINNAKHQIANAHWIPAATDVNLEPYTVVVQIEDNSTPIKGVVIYHVRIRVNKPGNITLNNALVNLNQEIQLQPGDPFNFRLSSVNTNSNNPVSITSNVASVLPGAVFTTDNASQQTASVNWTPTSAHVSSGAYVFTLTLLENSTPTPKKYYYTVKLKVGNIMSVKKENEVSHAFLAYPNPFSTELSFRFTQLNKAENLIIYNLLGEQIDAISLKHSASGEQHIQWKNAGKCAAGTYIARLTSEDKTVQTLKFTKLQ